MKTFDLYDAWVEIRVHQDAIQEEMQDLQAVADLLALKSAPIKERLCALLDLKKHYAQVLNVLCRNLPREVHGMPLLSSLDCHQESAPSIVRKPEERE